MSKTNDPHIGSFLAFACWADERIRGAYEGLPEWLPLPPLSGQEDPERAAALKHAAEHSKIRRGFLVREEELRLVEARIPADALNSEAMRAYIQTNAQMRALLNEERDSERCPQRLGRRLVDDWRPDRATIVRVIAGTHFAFGKGNRSTTAKLLNRGISRTDKVCGVTGSEVRNVVRPLLSKRVQNPQRLEVEALHLGWNAYALNEIWLDVTVRPEFRGLPMPRVADRIAASGELLDLYEMATDKALAVLDTDQMFIGLIEQQIKLLEHELRRRAA
jgi:hypothetical protein